MYGVTAGTTYARMQSRRSWKNGWIQLQDIIFRFECYRSQRYIRLKCPSFTASSSTSIGINLWHRRRGHINNTYIKQLLKTSGINISDSVLTAICEPCLHGKQHVKISRNPQQRVRKPHEIGGLWLSWSISLFTCSIYLLHHLGWWLHQNGLENGLDLLLKSKSSDERSEAFLRFKVEAELQSGFRIPRFRCYHGKG